MNEYVFVVNEHGEEIWYPLCLMCMDGEIRESINKDLAPCTEQEFFDEYAKRHYEKFGEVWEMNKKDGDVY